MEKTPAKLHLNRRLRTRLDVIKPDIRSRIKQKQGNQRFFKGNRAITFGDNDSVMTKDYRTKSWRQAIVEQISPVTYNVRTDDGRIWRRRTDQLWACNLCLPESCMIEASELPEDGILPDRSISVTPNVKNNGDKEGTLSISCNVSEYKIIVNGDISAHSPGEITSTKFSRTISTRTEVWRHSSRVPKPRKILNL
ncbi:hypothetical protein ALC56_15143 [Trachymyrmex septentrionalis]|uniref:Uncharacterized protein n=1 Tax=Trachymyrmex septentrionalis TaxID=34720 RepID=A0A195ERB5_9HYME|nr:hypothetical protein ALC56_15143 [Trachymyrmex septentrionalis]